MGNRKPVEAKKRKKKGRPSLLDLQKRSLRLQKQQEEEEEQQQPEKQNDRNPSPNPNPNPSNRRSTRRNPNLVEDDDDEEEESNGNRKEKKLKLVSRIPNGSDLAESEPDSDGGDEGTRKKRKIDAVETSRQNSNPKATDQTLPGNPSDSGTTTALPDKKLLVFILDRLQKKDTYGVFSEPVDPEELPDYHEIIENPMDFGTVRKKLDNGAYENLEQFESDIYLICSNAMQYNSSDTIYFRQARSIQELAKKDFDNLRQESDDEPEEKTVRRGRPPIKNVMKRIARAPVDRTGSDFSSDATLANASSNSTLDLPRKGLSFDKPSMMDASVRSSHAYRGNAEYKSERNEEYSGSPLKGIPMRNWKKFSSIDENRRNTYFQPLQSTCAQEQSILTAFQRERKLLMPVGLYMEHAYSRSLARFSANFGHVGWGIAAKQIQRVLPPGTKIGPGWVGDTAATHQLRPPAPPPPLSSPPDSSSKSKLPHLQCATQLSHEQTPNNSASASPTTSRLVDSSDSAQGMRSKSPLVNGSKPRYRSNFPSQPGKMITNPRSPEGAKTHIHSTQIDAEEKERLGNSQLCQPMPGSILPPNLIADFKSVAKQQKQPDLALQL